MGWTSEDGQHELWIAAEFQDGTRGIGVSGAGIPRDHIAVGEEHVRDGHGAVVEWRYVTRPAADVVGWRLVCDHGLGAEPWIGPLLQRVRKPEEHSPASRRFYSEDLDVDDGPFASDDEERVYALRWWHAEHLDSAVDLTALTDTMYALRRLEAAAQVAVDELRGRGVSWEAIGQAAGYSRQGAQQRWGAGFPTKDTPRPEQSRLGLLAYRDAVVDAARRKADNG